MDNNLMKFVIHFSRNSIVRGLDLYDENAVYDARKINNAYYFKVEGTTDNYVTSILLNEKNEVQDCYCSCPHYASGNLCKHLYASLLKLDDIIEGKDDDLIIENKQNNIVDNEPTEPNDIENINIDNIKKSKISNADLADFRIYCNSYDIDQSKMNSFLNKFDLNSHELATLFSILRKTKPMEIFLNHYENELDSDFFNEINLFQFPLSTPFKALIPYFLKHSNMLPYLNDISLSELFSHHRVPQLEDRITLLFLCLNQHLEKAISIFFADSENILSFSQMNALINYMKANMPKEKILNALDNRIKSKTITRIEAAFLYPYFNEETKKDFEDFFEKNYAAPSGIKSYYTYYDYDYEYYYGLPLNRPFYILLKYQSMANPTEHDLKTLYYLRNTLFTSDNDLIYAKRFKQLCQSLFRSKNPDFIKIYCCLSIILEYSDSNTIIKSLEEKAITYFSSIYSYHNCKYVELCELFYKLTLKVQSREDRIISNYSEGA